MKITNFDMIRNDVSKDKIKQYQTLDHQEIMHYPPQLRDQICSSIFGNANRKDMHIKKKRLMNTLLVKMKRLVLLDVEDLLKILGMIYMQKLGILDFYFCIFDC